MLRKKQMFATKETKSKLGKPGNRVERDTKSSKSICPLLKTFGKTVYHLEDPVEQEIPGLG